MGNKIDRDRQERVREGEFTGEVIRCARVERVAIWEGEGDLGERLRDKERRQGGKLVNRIRRLVHPESAMRGEDSNGGVEAKADTGDGRDTGGRSTVEHRRLRKGWGTVIGRFEASRGWDGRETVSSSS